MILNYLFIVEKSFVIKVHNVLAIYICYLDSVIHRLVISIDNSESSHILKMIQNLENFCFLN